MAASNSFGLYDHLVRAQRSRSSLWRFADLMRSARKPAAVRDGASLSGPSFRDLVPGLAVEDGLASRRPPVR